jgi:hypothetical protein
VLNDESAKVHRLVKVPLAALERWDEEHDVLDNYFQRGAASDSHSNGENYAGTVVKKKEV